MAHQTPGTAEPQASAKESRPKPSATTGAEGTVAVEAEEFVVADDMMELETIEFVVELVDF
jgi:hypothetical protein